MYILGKYILKKIKNQSHLNKGFQMLFKSQSATLQKWKLTLNTHASIDRFSTYEQQFEVCI